MKILLLLTSLVSVSSIALECPKGDISTIKCEINGKTLCFQHEFNRDYGQGGVHFSNASVRGGTIEQYSATAGNGSFIIEVENNDYPHGGLEGVKYSELQSKGQDVIWNGFWFLDQSCNSWKHVLTNETIYKKNPYSLLPARIKVCKNGTDHKFSYSLNETKLTLTEEHVAQKFDNSESISADRELTTVHCTNP